MMDRLTGEDNTLSEDTKKVIIDKVITKLVHIKHLKVILIWQLFFIRQTKVTTNTEGTMKVYLAFHG